MVPKDSDSPTQSQRRIATEVVWQGAVAGLGDVDAVDWLRMRLDGPVPWPEVVANARRLGLAPLFHLGLHFSPSLRAMIPSPAVEALRRATYVSAARVTRLERACAEVLAAASAAGVPALVLKGLALAALVYPSPMARPMDDVDLLVAEGDRGRLTEILHSLGYCNDLRGEEDFYVAGMAYSFDVHTGLVNTTRIPARRALWPTTFNELWSRSQSCVLGGIPVRTLSPTDTILHVATHAVHHHGLGGALWMMDLLASLRKWPHALDGNRTIPPPLQRSLWYCLELLSACGLNPAPEVRVALRPRWLFPGEARILSARKRGGIPQEIRYALTLACLPKWSFKAAFLRQLLFPRAGVHTDGFGDAGGSHPGRGQYWRIVMRLSRNGLRALFAGQPRADRPDRGDVQPDD